MANKKQSKFIVDKAHYGPISVRDLMEVVTMSDEFPNGLDTMIKIGDVEGNLGVVDQVIITAHKPGDVVLSIDHHSGDLNYGEE